MLTRQDREKFRPHITVQNKVSPQEAHATLDHLAATFTPFSATAEGLQLWWYRGGPWQPLAAVPFACPRRRRLTRRQTLPISSSKISRTATWRSARSAVR
ncbi:MAG: hypothetical protein AcusKO_25810 [Acuticoccus sp.]